MIIHTLVTASSRESGLGSLVIQLLVLSALLTIVVGIPIIVVHLLRRP